MANYTRLQLRSFQTSSDDWSGTIGCTLINNNSSTAYFAMEGERYWDGNRFNYKDIFNSASLSNLVNCSVVSGSTNAGFIVNPMATASFDLTSTSTIGKNLLKFSAPNAIVYSLGDTTASGSLLGVGFSFDTTSYLLDNYGGAAAAYSLRRLNSAYTGPAIKVQDNVGGATQDIGFDSNGELDTTALAAYGGSNDVFVETWYDQSGNSNDAEQTTSANRPKIYDGSTGVVTENGKPIIELVSGNPCTLLANTAITSANSHLFGVAKVAQAGNSIFIGTSAGGGNFHSHINQSGGGAVGTDLHVNGASSSITTRGQVYSQFVNQTLFNTKYDLSSATQTRIGMQNGSNSNYKMYNTQEFILYTTAQTSTTREGIESNQNTFYNIYS